MKTWIYSEISNKILGDLDMLEESFLTVNELIQLFNEALSDAEAEIHRLELEEDFFMRRQALSMVEGEDHVLLPNDIYGRDIRRLMFVDGSNIYPVKRFRGQFKFEDIEIARTWATTDDYRYYLEADSDDPSDEIVLVPAARETAPADAAPKLFCFYIREVKKVSLVADDNSNKDAVMATKVDLPVFGNFLMAFVKLKIKEKAMEPLESYMVELQAQRQRMIDTLAGFRDDDTIIKPDFKHYLESN